MEGDIVEDDSRRSCSADCWLRQQDPSKACPEAYHDFWLEDVPNTFSTSQGDFNSRLPYLKLRTQEIRLVRLEPAAWVGPLACSLTHVKLGHGDSTGLKQASTLTPEYEALSYCWGSGEIKMQLRCGEGLTYINSNLAHALRNLRYTDRVRYLWIDAICINQRDQEEKAQQVQMMLTIFQCAKRVVAWIGLQTQWTYLALEMQRRYLADGDQNLEPEYTAHQLLSERRPECLSLLKKAYKTLEDLYQRPWFCRTWVRQEVFGAKKLFLQCGRLVQQWDFFPSQITQFRALEQALARRNVVIGPFNQAALRFLKTLKSPPHFDIDNIPHWSKVELTLPWLATLQRGSEFEATDQRDKVYAYVSLIAQAAKLSGGLPVPAFPIDYTKSVSEIYQDLVTYLIAHDESLLVLQVLETRKDRHTDVPSWVPDWHRHTARTHIDYMGSRLYSKLELRPLKDTNVLYKSGKLRLFGYRLKYIKKVTEIDSAEAESIYKVWHHYTSWLSTFEESSLRWTSPNRLPNFREYLELRTFKHANLQSKRSYGVNSRRLKNSRCLVSDVVRRGDIIVSFDGSPLLFALRERPFPSRPSEFQFLGPALTERAKWQPTAEWQSQNREDFILV